MPNYFVLLSKFKIKKSYDFIITKKELVLVLIIYLRLLDKFWWWAIFKLEFSNLIGKVPNNIGTISFFIQYYFGKIANHSVTFDKIQKGIPKQK